MVFVFSLNWQIKSVDSVNFYYEVQIVLAIDKTHLIYFTFTKVISQKCETYTKTLVMQKLAEERLQYAIRLLILHCISYTQFHL